MKNYYPFREFSYEQFELSFDIDDSRLSSKELRSFLLQTEKLVDSINQTLNYHYAAGYEMISIDVLALEHGSFKLPLVFKKVKRSVKDWTENPTFSTIIGGIIVGLFMSGINGKELGQNVHDPIVIDSIEYLKNVNTARAVKRMLEITIENDSIHGVSIDYENEHGEREIMQLSRKTLKETKEFVEEVVENEKWEVEKMINMEVASQLSDTKSVLSLNYYGSTIEAEIQDINYLDYIISNNIVLQKGDRITVDLKAYNQRGARKYYITKVWDFRKS